MPTGPGPSRSARSSSALVSAGEDERLGFPCIFLEHGAIVFPEADLERNVRLEGPDGEPVDVFDAVDHLLALYHRIYVVDVEGVHYQRPQFEYLQELTRGQEMWVDAGCRDADQMMDVLVAGATKAVISTATLADAREISRSLKLSSQVVLDVFSEEGKIVSNDPGLRGASVEELVGAARERGIREVILSSREPKVDWPLVRRVAEGGPTYVGGPLLSPSPSEVSEAGAQAAIFPAKGVLSRWMTSGS